MSPLVETALEGFLTDLAVVVCFAALASVLCQRLRLPVVLGYLLTGLWIGPHVAQPLISDSETVHTLSELGVVLLMFSLGLEFRVRRLLDLGVRTALITALDVSLTLWIGFLTARAFGWSVAASLFAGGALSISSTMLVARTLDEERVERGLRELAFGVLIVQDLLAILLVALLSAVAQGASLSAGAVAGSVLRLGVFLALVVSGGFLIVPRFLRFALRGAARETMLLAAVGTCFAFALLARRFGYSVALGAFVAGSLAAESGEGRLLERLVRPLRDLFAAVFFVSIGMMIEPLAIARQAGTILAFTGVLLCGKTLGIGLGAFVTGSPPATALRAGLSLAQVGEFSFVIAALGLELGQPGQRLFPVAVGVAVLTALATPLLVRASAPFLEGTGRLAPQRLRRFAALYGTWIARLGEELSTRGERAHLRRALGWLVLDALLLCGVVIGFATGGEALAGVLGRVLPLAPEDLRRAVLALGACAALPFAVGLLRCVRRLGHLLADEVLPQGEHDGPDVADAPRRALAVGLQLGALLLVGVPILTATQPFVPALPGVGAFVGAGLLLGLTFWYGATKADQGARAGTEMILDLLARQASPGAPRLRADESDEVAAVAARAGAPCVGAMLSELALADLGASVVCIQRQDEGAVFPDPRERVRAGDVLVLSGAPAALREAARRIGDAGARAA